MAGVAASARRWWRQPDHFEWLSWYLNGRGVRLASKVLIAAVCLVLAGVQVALLASSARPHGEVPASVVSPLLGTVGAVLALLWLTRWPTRRQSIVFAVVSNICIATACLVQGDPQAGLLGCTAFAILAGYIAFFHTAGYMLFNFAVANATTLVLAARLAHIHDVVQAACAFVLIFMLNVAFPSAVQLLVQALVIDVRRSSLDALTGLLNRRTFYQGAHALLARVGESHAYLGVVMIDLDQFKKLNDTLGHAAGDQALVHVGDVLRRNCRVTSVIGRAGGEEFVVADTFRSPDLSSLAERLRHAIAAIQYPITASVGTASMALDQAAQHSGRTVIDRLVKHADSAMYEAKRSGGNQFRSAQLGTLRDNRE
jgi:diguanylate cyclase